jgi:interleukin-1 receptor-associated kinase 1/coatomer subunit beta'
LSQGGLDDGAKIAVKVLRNSHLIDDVDFKREFDNLVKLNHPNIVRLVAYSFETQHQHMEFNGESFFAESIRKALCFEFMHMGSLEKHLSGMILLDYYVIYHVKKMLTTSGIYSHPLYLLQFAEESGGINWEKRFKIIKGACEGLKYLHEGLKEPIYHLDLKPDNILLDENMTPKLADFGLSKFFGEEQTRVTHSPMGTV